MQRLGKSSKGGDARVDVSVQNINCCIENNFTIQTNIEKLFVIYFISVFLILLFIKIVYLIAGRKHGYIPRTGLVKIAKRIAKLLLFGILFVTLVTGSLLEKFTGNLLTYVTVIFVVYFLADAVFIENGTVLKLFNAEIKYDTIKENTNYLECLFRKNEVNSTQIEIANSFIRSYSDLITDMDDAYDALNLIVDAYLKEFHLYLHRVSELNSTELTESIRKYYNENNIYNDDGVLEKITDSCKKGIIRQIDTEVFLIPVCGVNYQEVIVLKGREVDAIDATNIKNIAVLLY